MRRRKRYPTRTDYLLPLLMAACTGIAELTGISSLLRSSDDDNMKIKKKQPKKHEPVRIVNPGDMSTARVHPRQGVKIVLDTPQGRQIQNVCDNASFEVKLKSDFLFLEKVEDNHKGQCVYYFQQKYDLSDWVQVCEVFLGEIVIQLVGNKHPQADQCNYDVSSIGVYHKLYDTYSDFLTVVNPNATVIKLEPHRTLEVTVFEPSWEEEEFDVETWKVDIEDFEVEAKGIFLEEVKKSTVNVRLFNADNPPKVEGYPIILRHKPAVNQLLEPQWREQWSEESSRKQIPGRETHFWFAFTEKSQQTMSGMKNGNYVVSRISMQGQLKNSTSTRIVKREFMVMLSKQGKPIAASKSMIPKAAKVPGNWASLPSLLYSDGPNLKKNFVKHLNDRPNNPISVLTNPGSTEMVDFHLGFEKVIIEIASPKNHWPDEPSDALWVVKEMTDSAKQALDIEVLPPSEVFKVRYQRFKISRKPGQPEPVKEGSLGHIEFAYPPKAFLPNGGSKRLSFWMEFKHKQVQSTSIYKNSHYSSGSCGYTGPYHYKNGVGQYCGPKIAGVHIEEIACDDLAHGEKIKKLSEVSTYDPQYDHYYYGGGWGEQIAACPAAAANSKKKDQQEPYRLLPAQGVPGMLTTTENNTGTSANSGQLIIHNPAHASEITLGIGQELVLCLSQPEFVVTKKEHKEQCRGELWGVNPIIVAGARPKVIRHNVNPVGSTKYRQEIVVTVDPASLPAHKGKVCAGAICLTCSSVNHVIRLSVQKSIDTYLEPVYNNTTFLKDFVSHEANKRRHLLFKNWPHGSNILVKPTDVIYVDVPDDMPSDWDESWSVQFVPQIIPVDLWLRFSDRIKNEVNQGNPWFSDDSPVFQNNTLIFRPLEQMAKGFKTLVEAIRTYSNAPYVHVGTVIFRSEKMQQVEDSDSLVETSVKIQRDIRIFVEIDRSVPLAKPAPTSLKAHNSWLEKGEPPLKVTTFHPKTISIPNPTDKMEVSAVVGETLEFHLTPPRSENNHAQYVWTCASYPTILGKPIMTSSGQDDVYRFNTYYAGEGDIVFKTVKEERKIRLKIQPKLK